METRKRATRSSTTAKTSENNGVSSPKTTRKKRVKAEPTASSDTASAKDIPNNDGEIIIKPDTITTTPKITEQEHIEGLFLPPSAAPPIPQAEEVPSFNIDSDLPEKYAKLEEFFNALLTAYMCLKGRKQACTWSIVRESVESLCNRRFELSHLAQMITVLPGALKLAIWKHASNRSGQDLSIEIISPSTSHLLSYYSLSEIRQSFKTNLLATATQNHTAFLKKKKLKTPASSQWHASFKQDAVPDIPQAPLPSYVIEIATAPKIEKEDDEEVKKEEEDANLTSAKGTEEHKEMELDKPIPEELAGLSAATIAAARAHEEAEKEESEEVKITRRLPMAARTMYSLCVVEKKRAHQRKKFIEQMVECCASPLSYEEAETSLERIAKIVPQWITFYTTDEIQWVRFDKSVTLVSCLGAINKVVREVVHK